MRYPAHRICLMALQGRRSLRGWPLPTKEEALSGLRRITGQDFGFDPAAWSAWIKANRKRLHQGGEAQG
jgi:hypothetical protein